MATRRPIMFAAVALAGCSLAIPFNATAATYDCDPNETRVAVTKKTQRYDRNNNGYVCEYQRWKSNTPVFTAWEDDFLTG